MKPPPDPAYWFAVRGGLPVTAISRAAVAAHRAQIEDNHGASLDDLDAQGGLDWYELYCGFRGKPLFPAQSITDDAARLAVLAAVTAFTLQEKTPCP